MANRLPEPVPPTIFGARMRLVESHRHRRTFRRGSLIVYNYRNRDDWMGAHEKFGLFVACRGESSPQEAASLLEMEVRRAHHGLGLLLKKGPPGPGTPYLELCGAVLHWETVGGLLVRRDGLLSTRCPSCDDRLRPRSAKPGRKCVRPAPVPRGC